MNVTTKSKITNTPLDTTPFPHLHIRDIFEPSLYEEMLGRFPKKSDNFMRPLSQLYKNRADRDWETVLYPAVY